MKHSAYICRTVLKLRKFLDPCRECINLRQQFSNSVKGILTRFIYFTLLPWLSLPTLLAKSFLCVQLAYYNIVIVILNRSFISIISSSMLSICCQFLSSIRFMYAHNKYHDHNHNVLIMIIIRNG